MLAVAGGLIAAVAYYSVALAPGVLTPAPFTFLAPAFLLEPVLSIGGDGIPWVPVLAAASFWLSAVPLLARPAKRPVFSYALYALTVPLSALFFLFAWHDGVNFQGTLYTAIVAAENAALVATLAVIAWASIRRPTAIKAWSFHFLLFFWLSWVAFPWLGEMP